MTVLEPVIQYLSSRGKGRRVRLDQVVEAVERPRRPVLRVMDNLTRDGYLEQIADAPVPPGYGECGPPRRNPTWRILQDPAPRAARRPAPRRQSGRARMWRAIRAARLFTTMDVARLAGVSRDSADNYVRRLRQAGYIRPTGKDGYFTVYMLVKDTVRHPRGDKEVSHE